MTARAKRAADVLRDFGWQIDQEDGAIGSGCATCGTLLDSAMRYCWHCGAFVRTECAASSLEQLEAAIAAANEEANK